MSYSKKVINQGVGLINSLTQKSCIYKELYPIGITHKLLK